MTLYVSPSVNIREFDLTAIVPQISTTDAAIGGVFHWGPIGQRVLVNSETYLVSRYGKAGNLNPETFFTAASFLAYGDKLNVSRAGNTSGLSPVFSATVQSGNATVIVSNTANLAVGMICIAAGNSEVSNAATIATIVNSTAFTLSSNSAALANSANTLQFVSNTGTFSAFCNTASVSNFAGQIVKHDDLFATLDGTFDTNILFLARYPGKYGNSLRVSVCDSANAFTQTLNLASYTNAGATVTMSPGSNTATVLVRVTHDGTSNSTAQTSCETATSSLKGALQVTDLLEFGNSAVGTQSLKVTALNATTSNVNATVAAATFTISFEDELRIVANVSANGALTRYWEFYDFIDKSPGQSNYQLNFGNGAVQDELHVVVVDEDGKFSGVPGTVLETYKSLSRASDAKQIEGGTNYYKDLINFSSKYIYVTNHRATGYVNTAINLSNVSNTSVLQMKFNYGMNGSDESTIAISDLIQAYDIFADAEEMDISVILQGKARGGTAGGQLANYLIDNIAETRKDCVVFISPDKSDCVGVNDPSQITDNIVEFRNTLRATSYGFLDSGYKYMYDRYNDLYRWIPLNGDMAGLAVRTDADRDAWWPFAGYNRGQIKNYIRLAWSPKKAYRDSLYKNDINPVIKDKANTILYGDKTMLGKPSAFDRINVRRLFIVLEKSISTAAKYFQFEFNDEFTRALFKNVVNPYLRDVQGKRGVESFLVKCDADNNPPEVRDRYELVGDIAIKPNKTINWVTLNFIAVPGSVSFNEVLGRRF